MDRRVENGHYPNKQFHLNSNADLFCCTSSGMIRSVSTISTAFAVQNCPKRNPFHDDLFRFITDCVTRHARPGSCANIPPSAAARDASLVARYRVKPSAQSYCVSFGINETASGSRDGGDSISGVSHRCPWRGEREVCLLIVFLGLVQRSSFVYGSEKERVPRHHHHKELIIKCYKQLLAYKLASFLQRCVCAHTSGGVHMASFHARHCFERKKDILCLKGPEKSEEIDVSLTNKGDSYEDESDAIRFAPLSSQKRFPLERETNLPISPAGWLRERCSDQQFSQWQKIRSLNRKKQTKNNRDIFVWTGAATLITTDNKEAISSGNERRDRAASVGQISRSTVTRRQLAPPMIFGFG
ncbi:hypothetical protein OUZ56_015204 [Daphnia magna]|uniref:Uncharacterized protein n=1 Tax=Daphnia magna TaxID=35525 RepID=A0ABR0AM45_9CRUS|nr:hypothetical protein OUZ56_015204 [Daphnia magna]